MKETFKNIPGYENLYQVSNFGQVKSLPRFIENRRRRYISKEKILKLTKNAQGYYVVDLCNGEKIKKYRTHQLVAMAFLNHKPNGHKFVIDHVDNNPENNCLDNLQIITQRGNISKGFKNKDTTSKFTGVCWNKKNKKWVTAININGKPRYLGSFTDENRAKIAYEFAVFQVDKLEKLFT